MALLAVKSTIERALDKDLSDLVRGIRSHKDDETKYINGCIGEIKNELKTGNMASKANAVNKLTYLQMLGYDISWAAFNIIEIMSSSKFSYKRIGYLAASQCFDERTDVLMLATNLIRKDLTSGKVYDSSVALSNLSCFVTSDLAKDLCDDILALTMSPRPYIAKKAVLLLYKVFLKNPDALRAAFPRLRKKLEDPDPGVQSAAVNVICELARKNPQNYLSLSPVFFKLMTSSTNNWVLIKIIKLFGALTPLEPRLGKKLIEPLTNLIHNTSAMSLLYECINTVLAGVPDHNASIQLCVQKLCILIEDSDQNLKYLGLLAMGKILRHHPKSVQAHKDLILACLEDRDESIRLRALDLLHGMVSRANLLEIVRSLVRHLTSSEISAHFRAEIIATVVRICSQANYQYVLSFEWYISILVELAQLNTNRSGEMLADQLLDVAVRVASVRPFAVSQMAIFLRSCKSMINHSNQASLHDVVYAAAWICGEYAGFLSEPRETLDAMLGTANLVDLRGHIQSVLVLNSLKLYCKLASKWFSEATNGCKAESPSLQLGTSQPSLPDLQALLQRLLEVTNFLMDKISLFVHSANLEVQERAVSIHQLLHFMTKRLSKLRLRFCESALNSAPMAEVTDFICAYKDDDQVDSLDRLPSKVNQPTGATQQETLALDLLEALHALLYELCSLFSGELNPVAPKAQHKVPVPEGLDLDAWINEPPLPSTSRPLTNSSDVFASPPATKPTKKKTKLDKKENASEVRSPGDGIFSGLMELEGPKHAVLAQAELDEIRRQRLQMQELNPHYLKASKSSLVAQAEVVTSAAVSQDDSSSKEPSTEISRVLVEPKLASSDEFALEMQKHIKDMSKPKAKASTSGSGAKTNTKKTRHLKKENIAEQAESEELSVEPPTNVTVSTVIDMPDGVAPTDLESPDEADLDSTDPHRLLNIQLDVPLVRTTDSITPKTDMKVKGGRQSSEIRPKISQNSTLELKSRDQGISEAAFFKLLTSSELTALCRVKVRCPATAEAVNGSTSMSVERAFAGLLQHISTNAAVSVVECVGTNASVYTEAAANPVCLLIKLSTQTGSILIEAKSSQQATADEVVQRIKRCVKSFKGRD